MHAGEPNGVNEDTARPLGHGAGGGETPAARIERLAEIEYVTAAVLGHLDLDTLLEELLARTCRIMNVDTAAILLLDAETNELVARAAKGLEEEVAQGLRIPLGHGFAGRIAAERRTVSIEDVDHAEILNPLLREKGVRSLLGTPLLVQDDVRGVLHVGSLTRREFNEADRDLLRLVAGRATFVIEHSRLYL